MIEQVTYTSPDPADAAQWLCRTRAGLIDSAGDYPGLRVMVIPKGMVRMAGGAYRSTITLAAAGEEADLYCMLMKLTYL